MAVLKRLKFAATSEALQRRAEEPARRDASTPTWRRCRPSSTRSSPATQDNGEKQASPSASRCRRTCRAARSTTSPRTPPAAAAARCKRIGEDVAEKLDYEPGVFTVERHVRGKWVCAHCETLVQAPVAPHIIDKGIPTTGLLAQVLVAKFLDHLPLYRQEAHLRARRPGDRALDAGAVGRRVRRAAAAAGGRADGRAAARTTCCTPTRRRWRCSSRATARRTGPTCGATARRSFNPIKAVVFDFAESRGGQHVRELPRAARQREQPRLAGHARLRRLQRLQGLLRARRDRGRLHGARPAQVPRAVGQPQQHARRAGAEVLRDSCTRSSARCATLDADERRGDPADEDQAGRRRAAPVADAAAAEGAGRLGHRQGHRLQPQPLGGARRASSTTATLPIDNNWVENQIRPIAIGRNNWLFAGSLRAGKRAAAIMSLVHSARLNGHDPYAYLKDVLERLPTQPASRIDELLPHRWRAP